MLTIIKNKLFILCIVGPLSLAGCSNESAQKTDAPGAASLGLNAPVATAQGLIAGSPSVVAGVTAFKGIPFGAPPVGELRWKTPQPVTKWEGVRRGDEFGNACIQAASPQRVPNNVSIELPDSPQMSEDCFYLNVWTPAKTATQKLPVMVWIYGGAYSEGAGSSPHNQGDQLAAKGVIVVSFNYRLGSLGFLAHPELTSESPNGASGNYGLADTLAALQWVQQNIAAFGGDPSNVTIFGESAGSAMSAALVGSPLSKGLFTKAISESGTWMGLSIAPMRTRESAEKQTVEAASKLGLADLAALRALPAEEAFAKLPRQGMIIDGWIFPEELSSVFDQGRQNAVSVLVGSNRDEGSFSASFGPPVTLQSWNEGAAKRWGELVALGQTAYPASTDAEAAANSTQIFADNMAWLMQHYAEKQRAIGSKAYVYHFVQAPPYAEGARNLGVCHTCEIPYVFNNLGTLRVYPDASSAELALASPVDAKVAQITSSYWVNFAKTGNPNGAGLAEWPLFETVAKGPVLHINDMPVVGDSLGPVKVALYNAIYERQLGTK